MRHRLLVLLVLIAAVGLGTRPTGAQAEPFTSAGAMGEARNSHTATLLSDDRVLISGGTDDNFQDLDSAEFYDPATGTFTPTGTMATARVGHTATLLSDGKILMVAGTDEGAAPADLFGPETETFSPTGAMVDARRVALHTATRLADGRVLITGGWDADFSALASAEIYDPDDGSFTATGNLTRSRRSHTATLLPDGGVLIAGGFGDAGLSAEIYNPASGAFSPTGEMVQLDRSNHSATRLVDGRLLIIGQPGTANVSAELFDPVSGAFGPAARTIRERRGHTATLLNDGRVLVLGGFLEFDDPPSAEIYDPAGGTFTLLTGLAGQDPLVDHTATLLANGSILITGGRTPSFGSTALAQLFLPERAESPSPGGGATLQAEGFTLTGSMGTPRNIHVATRLLDGRVLITGGIDPTAKESAEIYDPDLRLFLPTRAMNTGRFAHTATLLQDGRVLIAGGISGEAGASAEIFNPATDEFLPTGSPLEARQGSHTATLLADGRVLVTGGNNLQTSNPFGELASAELYDPATGTFAATGSMMVPRTSHTATLLTDGRVLIAGGFGLEQGSSAEIYDPATGQFTLAGGMIVSHAQHTATRLQDGRVLVAGSPSPEEGDRAELFDPATGTFAATGSMSEVRQEFTATLLPDGRVLIAGGSNVSVNPAVPTLRVADLYDPASGTFTPTGSLAFGVTRHTATALADGTVLVAGGFESAGAAGRFETKTTASLYSLQGMIGPTRSVTLSTGWNLVGWTGATPPATATASIANQLNSLFTFDAVAKTFLAFNPAVPFLSTLTDLRLGDGVWINVSAPTVWQQPAFTQARSVALRTGFNLVMWTGPDGTAVTDAVAGIGDALAALFTYDAIAQAFRKFDPALDPALAPFLNTATTLNSGDGVWINVTADVTWDQPAP